MPRLSQSDKFHIQAAHGWLELGNAAEASAELDRITPELRDHPDVLELRLEIFHQGKTWQSLFEAADSMVRLCPERSTGWVQRSFALHELRRTGEAYEKLLPAAEKFPDVWPIPYNLACYCAQLGRLYEAKQWFKKAMAADEETAKREAIDDLDLKPLWDSMSGTDWKME